MFTVRYQGRLKSRMLKVVVDTTRGTEGSVAPDNPFTCCGVAYRKNVQPRDVIKGLTGGRALNHDRLYDASTGGI